jgi:hypothetical protein
LHQFPIRIDVAVPRPIYELSVLQRSALHGVILPLLHRDRAEGSDIAGKRLAAEEGESPAPLVAGGA